MKFIKFLNIDKTKRTLWGISTGHFILDMHVALLIPLYPIIAQRLNINLATISLIIALGHSMASILEPLFGYVSDKIQKRFFIFWGLIFVSLFMPLGYIAPNPAILTLCIISAMAGNAFYHPQATSVIKDFHKESISLSKAIGIFLGFGTIGYSIGPYLSSYIVEKFGSNFVYIGILGILSAIFSLFFIPKIKKRKIESTNNFISTLKEIIKNKTCVILILLTILKACLIMSFGTYIPFLLKQYGFLTSQTGLIMTMFFVSGGLAMIFASHFEKKIKLKGMIIASYLPLLPLTLLAILALKYHSKILAVILFIIIGFFILLAAGSILAGAQKLISNTGTISGIIQGFTLAIGSLLLIPLGNLAQHFGVSLVLVLISSIAAFTAIFCSKTKLFEF